MTHPSTSAEDVRTPAVDAKTPLAKRAVRVIDIGLVAAWGAAFWLVMLAAVPEHAVGANRVERRTMALFLPESWAFFTRNPREHTVRFFEERPDGTLVPGNPTDVRGNRFFPSRADRIRELTVGAVVQQVPKDAWEFCRGPVDECVRSLRGKPVHTLLAMFKPSYCGTAVIQESDPVPWAWRRADSALRVPSKLVRVTIECRILSRST